MSYVKLRSNRIEVCMVGADRVIIRIFNAVM